MTDRGRLADRARTFFDDLWKEGDPWGFETSHYDHESYAIQLALVSDRRYASALEIGCGSGTFSRRLAPVTDRLLSIDVAPAAIAAARAAGGERTIEYRVANIMEDDVESEGPFDLVVLSETIYYLGWLYPFFDVCWLAHRLFEATRPGGRLLMANTCGGLDDYLLRPGIIRTYRDLFANVGFDAERESTARGLKNAVTLEALVTLFGRPHAGVMGTGSEERAS